LGRAREKGLFNQLRLPSAVGGGSEIQIGWVSELIIKQISWFNAKLVHEAELAVLEESSVIADPDDLLKTVVSKDCDADFDAQDNFETNSA
jgi:hypothetical protein